MSLMKRNRPDLDWPTWSRRMLDLPESFMDLFEDTDIKLEEFEQDGHLVVRAEMPGLDPEEDVTISVTDHTLHLHAERRSETNAEDKKGFRSEFRYGAFSRSLPLPVGATAEDVTATYTDGILEVRIPIDDETAEATKIPVSRG